MSDKSIKINVSLKAIFLMANGGENWKYLFLFSFLRDVKKVSGVYIHRKIGWKVSGVIWNQKGYFEGLENELRYYKNSIQYIWGLLSKNVLADVCWKKKELFFSFTLEYFMPPSYVRSYAEKSIITCLKNN